MPLLHWIVTPPFGGQACKISPQASLIVVCDLFTWIEFDLKEGLHFLLSFCAMLPYLCTQLILHNRAQWCVGFFTGTQYNSQYSNLCCMILGMLIIWQSAVCCRTSTYCISPTYIVAYIVDLVLQMIYWHLHWTFNVLYIYCHVGKW